MLNTSIRVLRGTFDFALGNAEDVFREILASADVTIGPESSNDIQVHDPRVSARILRDGSLGLGESYMDGWWDADDLDGTLTKIGAADLNTKIRSSWKWLSQVAKARLFNLQRSRAFEVGEAHYDIGNDLYTAMLDSTMAYTCGYWREADTLQAAQEAKLDLVCRKIGLEPGMSVLELGCGWGTFAKFAAENYGAKVHGVTVSKEQVALGQELCKGLPVTLELRDYRTVTGQYDAVVSIGLMEHVGVKNYRTYMQTVDRCLRPGGISFIHTIGGNRSRTSIDPWFGKYIFPNAVVPTMTQLGAAIEGLFVLEDLHNFGPHYDQTCMAWHDNFIAAWPSLEHAYDERFYRMWRYYLCQSAAGFRSRQLQLYQIVLTRPGTQQPDCRKV
jgi:cyclopropane-fatty-acyl-phospholipid synthase